MKLCNRITKEKTHNVVKTFSLCDLCQESGLDFLLLHAWQLAPAPHYFSVKKNKRPLKMYLLIPRHGLEFEIFIVIASNLVHCSLCINFLRILLDSLFISGSWFVLFLQMTAYNALTCYNQHDLLKKGVRLLSLHLALTNAVLQCVAELPLNS